MKKSSSPMSTVSSPRRRFRAGPPRRGRLAVEELESRVVPAALPRPDHVVIVIEENRDYSQIIGSATVPYINSLAQQGALMTASTGVEHPSQPNYLDLFSGANQGTTGSDARPSNPPPPFTTPNLGAELLAAGLSFTGYSESLPSAGYDGDSFTTNPPQNQYMRKHNPWTNWVNNPVGANQLPASVNQPFTSFPADFTQLPTVSIVVPNEVNDMHDPPNLPAQAAAQADTWLQNNLSGYAQWAKTHNSLLIVTWDENDTSPGNHIATILDGQMVQPGTYSQPINHYNVLRTVEDMYGLPAAGASASAAPITGVWQQSKLTATIGAYDPLLGNWSLRSANSAGPADAGSFQFGGFGPNGFADGLVGDWAGTGQFTPAVFYPGGFSNTAVTPDGTWFLRGSNGPTNSLVVAPFQFGGPTTIPIAGDWFGDGHFDVGVYDVPTGTFFLRHGLNSGAVTTFQLGGPGFYPIAGDWDGDGKWTVGVVQLSTMTWYLKNSNTAGVADVIFQWGAQNAPGLASVLPLAGDWGGSGHSGIGLAVPVQNQPASPFNNQNLYLLRNEVSAGLADAGFFAFGAAGDTPVAGQWRLPTNPLSHQLADGEGPGAAAISQAQLDAAVTAALGRLAQAGVNSAVLGQLASASYQVAALPAGELGYTAAGRVRVSADGAGHGWFVDPTPNQDEEFSGGVALAGSGAAGKEDLLTVVLHEMGHLVGANDGGSGLMASVLPTGTRRTAGIDAVFAGA